MSPMFARMGEPDCVGSEESFSALELGVAAEAVLASFTDAVV